MPKITSLQRSMVVMMMIMRPQRVHIHHHYGIRSQETIPMMVLGTYFLNGSVYGSS